MQQARKIGHMPYDQVKQLFDETSKRRNDRRGCPNCSYNTGPNWHNCDTYSALAQSITKYTLAWIKELRIHRESCLECHIESYWEEFESYCEACEEIYELFQLCSARLQRIATNEARRLFQEEHGRKPATMLELAEWQDLKEKHY